MKFKYFAFILMALMICTGAEASNKVKYNRLTGEVICMGAMPDLQAGDGEEIIEVEDAVPADLGDLIVGGSGQLRKRNNAEKKAMRDARQAVKEARQAKKQAVKDKLQALGISADDLKTLIKDAE